MIEAVAVVRFDLMVAADKAPTITAEEVRDLRNRARAADESGRFPADAGYVPTWTMRNLYRLAAEAWRVKLARAAHHFDFTADGSSLSKRQQVENLERMVEHFSRLAAGGVQSLDVGNEPQLALASIING